MRGCEFSLSPTAGKTLPVEIRDLIFRDKHRKLIPIRSNAILSAEYITVIFRDQKSGKKWEARSQQRTDNPILCPVRRWATVAQRLLTMGFPLSTQVYTTTTDRKGAIVKLTSTYVKTALRIACTLLGGKAEFGFDASEIGSKSIRSGAAMALFIADVSVPKIMILGRWNSDAFLVYIRPQVIEWTNNMSKSMTMMDHFIDVGQDRALDNDTPRLRRQLKTFNGSFLLPRLNLAH
jgi:hypothetical protein